MEEQSTALKKKSSGEMYQSKHTENDEMYPKVKNVANNDDLIKKLTAITKEHLATLAPVISDLITFVSKKVTVVIIKYRFDLNKNYSSSSNYK